MSPWSSGRESGMPCAATLFTATDSIKIYPRGVQAVVGIINRFLFKTLIVCEKVKVSLVFENW
jgi:hypothetical protein